MAAGECGERDQAGHDDDPAPHQEATRDAPGPFPFLLLPAV